MTATDWETEAADRAAHIDKLAADLGLSCTAEFIPTPNQPGSPSLHWTVTVHRGRASMSLPYSAGCAHAVIKNPSNVPEGSPSWNAAVRVACEEGRIIRLRLGGGMSPGGYPQPGPSLRDVLYALVMDSSVLESGGFEDWADELGFDTDSRKAESTYRACIDQSLKFRQLVADEGLKQLQTAFQDH